METGAEEENREESQDAPSTVITKETKTETEDKRQEDGLPDTISGYHLLKWVPWIDDSFVPIITQNENGPCPLLALCNVLILQNLMKLPKGETLITTQQLLDLLGSCLLHCRPKEFDHNYEQNMQDAIATFPRLLTGLDVNVKFNSVDGFEFTQELSIFDLLGVHLYHGWLADPSDTVAYPVVSSHSYNQLVEFAINNLTSLDPKKQEEALVSQDFLENTASQLTYHGLCELNQKVTEGELCVFFRNNHFNTLLKREGKLMLLVTDFGFLNELGHVWHLLSDIDDSGDFLDANFSFVGPSESTGISSTPPQQTRSQPTSNTSTSTPATIQQQSGVMTDHEKLDHLVAANLQAQEEFSVHPVVNDDSKQTFETDADLALRLQEEELEECHAHQVPPIHHPTAVIPNERNSPPPSGRPPSTREEYEATSRNYQRQKSSDSCLIL